MAEAVRFKGLELLTKTLRTLPKKVEKKVIMKALRKGGRVIIKDARARVPVRTGKLRKSLFQKAAPARRGKLLLQVATKKEAWYAHLVEFGTSTTRAQPFLRPAMDSKTNEAIAEIGKQIFQGILEEIK